MANSTSTRVAVDIGGTFTDVVLDTGAERFATKVPTTHADPADAVLEGLERVMRIGRRTPARRLPHPARHHPRHQRADRAQRRRHGPRHDAGPPRRAGDGPGEPLRAVRHQHRPAAAARATPAPPHSAGTDERSRGGPPAVGRRRGAGTGTRPYGAGCHQRRRGVAPRLRQPRPRTPHRSAFLAERLPDVSDHARLRSLPGDPRVRTPLDGLRQRLRPAPDGALPDEPVGRPR